jgi:PPOX class probable F420-dependent enzyme
MSSQKLLVPPTASKDVLLELLSEQHFGTLVTLHADGRPQVTQIGYVYDSATETARVVARQGRTKVRNLARDFRAALHVTNKDCTLWLTAECSAEISPASTSLNDPVGSEVRSIFIEYDLMPVAELDEFLASGYVVDQVVLRLRIQRVYGGNSGGQAVPSFALDA